jgi:hypothetical protein
MRARQSLKPNCSGTVYFLSAEGSGCREFAQAEKSKVSSAPKPPNQKAPGGASRCRVLASGNDLYLLGSRSAARSRKLVAEFGGLEQENAAKVKLGTLPLSANQLLCMILSKSLHIFTALLQDVSGRSIAQTARPWSSFKTWSTA